MGLAVEMVCKWLQIYNSSDQSDSDDENEGNEQEYASLDSVPSDNSLQGGTFSPRSSEPPSLTESMHLMDEILSNKTMDRLSKIDKLEAILSAATLLPTDPVSTAVANAVRCETKISVLTDLLECPGRHHSKLQYP